MLAVDDGWLICPHCRRKVLRIYPDTTASRLEVFCRHCRNKTIVDIDRGQSYESPSP